MLTFRISPFILTIISFALMVSCGEGDEESNETQQERQLSQAPTEPSGNDDAAAGPNSFDSSDKCEQVICKPGTECISSTSPQGYTCVDIDACAEADCGPGMECLDLPAPNLGFECVQLDECLANPCARDEKCIDHPAPETGYTCEPIYELIGKLVPAAEAYDTRFAQISGSQLASTHESFGEQGYVITAATTNSAGYSLWGFKPEGSTDVFDTRFAQISGSQLTSTLESFGEQGYVITAATTNSAGYSLWGFKPEGLGRRFRHSLCANQWFAAYLDSRELW